MPIYMPGFTIATAILSVLATIFANNRCFWISPLLAAIVIALIALHCLGITRIPKALFLIFLVPILIFHYASHCIASRTLNDLSNYANKNVVFTAVFLDTPQAHQSINSFNQNSRNRNSSDHNSFNHSSFNHNSINYTATLGAFDLVFPEQKKLSGKTRLIIICSTKSSPSQFKAGQMVQIEGLVKNIGRKQEPWQPAVATTSKHTGLFSQIYTPISHIHIIENLHVIENLQKNDYSSEKTINKTTNTLIEKPLIDKTPIDQIRKHIVDLHIQYLGPKIGSLLTSMVLGDQATKLDSSILNAFRKVGLSHIVAASGFNLTIVTVLTYWILRRLSAQRQIITCLSCGNVLFYAALAGLSASIVRSAIACLLFLLVRCYYRKLHNLAALAIVVLVNLIADPTMVADLGAQLSYAAVTSILLGAEPLTKTVSLGSDNKIINFMAGSISVILLAQAAVLPIQLYHFWQASFLFLPANLMVDPLVGPITIIGFISSCLGFLDLGSIHMGSFLCHLLDLLTALPLQMMIYIIEKLSSSNLALINTGQPSLIAIGIYYASLIFFLSTLAKTKYRAFSLALLSVALIVLLYKPALKQPVIIFLPTATLAINPERKAICVGEQSRQTNKILSFYGAELISIKYDPDKNFQFTLLNKQLDKALDKTSANIVINEETQYTRFILTLQAENNTLSKKYIVSIDQSSTYQTALELSSPLQSSLLSLAQFSKELPGIDVRICCPPKSATVKVQAQQLTALLCRH